VLSCEREREREKRKRVESITFSCVALYGILLLSCTHTHTQTTSLAHLHFPHKQEVVPRHLVVQVKALMGAYIELAEYKYTKTELENKVMNTTPKLKKLPWKGTHFLCENIHIHSFQVAIEAFCFVKCVHE
jgi:hypothetical protein